MKRILFVHHTSTIGGASYCLLNIVRGLDRTVFEPVVALKCNGQLVYELRRINVEVVLFKEMATVPYNRSIFSRRTLPEYLSVKRSLRGFERLIEAVKVDIVYFNNMMLAPYLEASKKAGCSTVLHVREHWPLDEHKWQLDRIRKMIYTYCDRLIAINRYSASMFPEINATIVYDWIDMEKRDKPMPLSDIFGEDVSNKKVFLYLGGMARFKGAYEVIKAFIETLKGDEYRLLVLGFTKEISQSGGKAWLRKILYSLGLQFYEFKVKLLAQTDRRIVCIPSVYEITDLIRQSYCELSFFTIPHANLPLAEAIIVGTPVIAALTDESDEYSLGGKLACLFPINNYNAFKQTIKNFINDGCNVSTALKSKYNNTIKQMFSERDNMEKIEKTLRSL